MMRKSKQALLLSALTLLLTGAAVWPLYSYIDQSLARAGELRRDLARQFTLTKEEQFDFPKGFSLVSKPELSKWGDRVLLKLQDQSGMTRLYLAAEGQGLSEIASSSKTSVTNETMDYSGRKVAFFGKTSSGEERLCLWEEGRGERELVRGAFRGKWSISLSGDGRKLMLFAEDDQASYEGPEEVAPARAYFLSLSEPLAAALPDGSDGMQTPELEPFSMTSEVQLAQLKPGGLETVALSDRKIELKQVKKGRPEQIDLNADRYADLLTFESGEGDEALFRSYLLNGFNAPLTAVASTAGKTIAVQAGDPLGVPIYGDYNGDGITDVGTFSPGFSGREGPERANWKIFLLKGKHINSESAVSSSAFDTGELLELYWGYGKARAVPADYDGDGATDVAVYEPETGNWQILLAKGGFNCAKAALRQLGSGETVQWGLPGDIPVPADYNGDGCTDFAVVRVAEGDEYEWLIKFHPCAGLRVTEERFNLGGKGGFLFPADYDGDGKAEAAVYAAASGEWSIRYGQRNVERVRSMVPGGFPFVQDFDGDGISDRAFYVPAGKHHFQILFSSFSEKLQRIFRGEPPIVARLGFGSERSWPVQLLLSEHQRGNAALCKNEQFGKGL